MRTSSRPIPRPPLERRGARLLLTPPVFRAARVSLPSASHTSPMSAINVTSVRVLNNPAAFDSPIQVEISYECLYALKHGEKKRERERELRRKERVHFFASRGAGLAHQHPRPPRAFSAAKLLLRRVWPGGCGGAVARTCREKRTQTRITTTPALAHFPLLPSPRPRVEAHLRRVR